MPRLHWESHEDRKSQWEIAKHYLKDGTIGEGIKLKRPKDSFYSSDADQIHTLNHSFIVINGKIFALAVKGEVLGQGNFGKVKLVEDEDRNVYVIKTSHTSKVKTQELDVLTDLGLLQGQTQRKDKHYLLLNFLGTSLDKVKFESDQHQLDACLQIIQLVNKLNKGQLSKSSQPYYHNDIKPSNIVLNQHGKVSLIDFGLTSYLKTPEFIEGYPGFHAPEIITQGYSPESDSYSLGITLKRLLPDSCRLHHTATLLSAYYPHNRPSKDVVEIDFLVELHKHSDTALAQTLLNHHGITKEASEAKAIAALLEGSIPGNNLATTYNIDLIRTNRELKTALITVHNYLNSVQPGWKRTYADYNKDRAQRLIQNLIDCADKSPTSIQSQMQQWQQQKDNESRPYLVQAPGSQPIDSASSTQRSGYFSQSGIAKQADLEPQRSYFSQSGLNATPFFDTRAAHKHTEERDHADGLNK
ncbi:kinase [Piscirickettsiaceae bacterium NZ-RLO2]|nr:kinase [Piscirickettsiaceae bacterium NZ-RLO2]